MKKHARHEGTIQEMQNRLAQLRAELDDAKAHIKSLRYVDKKSKDNVVSKIRRDAFEAGISPMMHNPFFLFGNDILFHSTMGREAAITFSVLSTALINTFAYNLSLSMHGYLSYEISLTDYVSQGKLIQLVASLLLLVMFTILIGMSKTCLERKLHGSPDSLYDGKTQTFMLMGNTVGAAQ